MSPPTSLRVLEVEQWQQAQDAHRERVSAWTEPHLARRREGLAHPVEDFLFTYYSHRPAALLRWHPGYGVGLRASPEHAGRRGYVSVRGVSAVSQDHLAAQGRLLRQTRNLLRATADRPPNFGCFGMHEWAMLYRLQPDEVRHPTWPLRLGTAATDQVVESHRIACSHFDAFRFFTAAARPRNTVQPGRDDRPAFEQPGCLHAGMDLYKHAFRLSPMVPSELVADCFELARDIRALDMRASPYDFTELGYEPVPVETPAGKSVYTAAQREFADRAAPLRQRLVTWCEKLLGCASQAPDRNPPGSRPAGLAI